MLKKGRRWHLEILITLLDTIDCDSDKSYDYVHIVEDDVVLSKQLYGLIDQLKKKVQT